MQQDALISKQRNYRPLFEDNPHPVLLHDRISEAILDVNASALRLYGYTREQFSQLKLSDIELDSSNRSKESFGSQSRKHRCKDGSVIEVEVSLLLPSVESSKEAFLLVQDVSEQRRKEHELTTRAEFERLVADLSSRFSAGKDFDSAVNSTLKTLGEYSGADRSYVFLVDADEGVANNSHEWCAPGISPLIGTLQNLSMANYPWFFKQFDHGALHISDVSRLPPLAKAEKKVIEVGGVRSMICLPMHEGPQLVGFVGMDNVKNSGTWSRDQVECLRIFSDLIMSALAGEKVAQQLKLNSHALNAAANAVVITNVNGEIEWVNDAFVSNTGYGREEAIGSTPGKLLRSGVHAAEYYQCMWETILAGKVWRGETVNRRRDGSHYTEQQTITPVHDSTGAITHFVAIKEDISEKKRAEANLLQAQKMEALGRLAGGLAHDCNNMLSVIIGNSEMLKDKLDLDESGRCDLDEIVQAGKHSARLIKQLLGFASQQPISPKLLDLNETVSSLIEMLQALVGKDIELLWSPGKNLQPAKIDPYQIHQVLVNLVLNSKAAITQSGLITIETRSRPQDEPSQGGSDYLELRVTDDGEGMDPATEARAFEPFFTTRDIGQGSGLGLPTVFGIARQNNGFVELATEEGKGTSVSFCLPSQEAQAPRAKVKGELEVKTPHSKTLLLVEDEPALLRLSKRLLEKLGYKVLAADNPELAIQLATKHQDEIDLLVTDVMMPGMSGNEVYKKVLELRPNIACLYVSGYPADVINPKGVLEQDVHFLQKPYSLSDLADSVKKALGHVKK